MREPPILLYTWGDGSRGALGLNFYALALLRGLKLHPLPALRLFAQLSRGLRPQRLNKRRRAK